MVRPAQYKTKQSEAILSYIASQAHMHVTVGQIIAHFESLGAPIGLATIYRHLDKLTTSGKIRQLMIDNISSACYQYIDENEHLQEHFHLKCEGCGELFHLDCSEINTFQRHITNEHAFQINPVKTVFYGKCQTCYPKAPTQK